MGVLLVPRASCLSQLPPEPVAEKVLSDLAIREPAAFAAIVEKAKAALPAA